MDKARHQKHCTFSFKMKKYNYLRIFAWWHMSFIIMLGLSTMYPKIVFIKYESKAIITIFCNMGVYCHD